MKHPKTRMLISLLMAISMCLPIFIFAGCGNGETGNTDAGGSSAAAKIGEFYEAVVESQTRMDIVADDIYDYWYDAIYNDKYSGNINLAIAFALDDNSENIDFIKENETKIQSLYKEVRDSELKDEIKAVMTAYSDYYEFVINVSGSFNSYSSNKETYKKELANALKHLSMEL